MGQVAAREVKMTTAEFDHLLKARGWRYDDGEEQFFDGERVLDWEELITVKPDLDLEELAPVMVVCLRFSASGLRVPLVEAPVCSDWRPRP